MKQLNTRIDSEVQRRQFIKWVSMSSLSLGLPLPFVSCNIENKPKGDEPIDLSNLKNVFDFEKLSRKVMGEDALLYLNGGADDLLVVWIFF